MLDSDSKETSQLAFSLLSALQTDVLSEGGSLASQNQVEELERNLRTSLALVGTLKNASRPVNSLPPIVLRLIFALLQQVQEDKPHPKDFRCPSYEDVPPNGWILVTHVCRHWRSVAHGIPSLWNRIHIHSNPRHVQFFLDKSFPLPLTILCGSLPATAKRDEATAMWTAIVARTLHSICANATRIKELYFLSNFPLDAVLQRDQFSRIVVPSISSRLPSASPILATTKVDIFTKLFSYLSPQMRKLSLHGLPISYMLDSRNRLDNLTHLSLYEQPRWSENQSGFMSNLDVFLDILQASSQTLQFLTLIRAGPAGDISLDSAPKTYVSKRPTVSLPALMSLEIGDWISSGNIAYFLAHLSIPGKTKRCIWGDNLKYLSSILFSVDPDTALSKGRGWDSEIKRVIFTAVKGKDMIGIHNNAVYIQGRLDFLSIYPLFRDQPHIFERVDELILTSTISPAALTIEEYRLLFAVLPDVRRLLIVDMDVSLILQALGLFSEDTLAEPALPELRDITIQYSQPRDRFGATPATRDPLGNEYKISSLSIVLALAKLSQRRAGMDCPFEKLTLDFGARRIIGDLVGDYLEILEHLRRWVDKVELVDDSHSRHGGNLGIEPVLNILDGMWPSGASLGNF